MDTMDKTREIVRDTRLSSDARIVALEVHLREGDQHEISFDEWSMLLGQAGNHRIRRALKQSELAGWIDRTPGGGGHSDSFASSLPESTTLRGDSRGEEQVVLSQEGEVAGGAGAAREAEPELHPRAQALLERKESPLNGCRGALRDYLDLRVDPDRQYAYIRTLVGWFEGMDPSIWRKPNGRPVDTDRRTSIVADALNDLAASDEDQMKRPAGDPANLRTKIQVRIAQREDPHGRNRRGSRDDRSSGSDGSGRRTREGLTGHLG